MASVEREDEGGLERAVEMRLAAQARSARAFASASQHSSWVRRLRFVLLFGSLAAIALIVLAFVFRTFFVDVSGLSLGALAVDGGRVTMEKPRLTGSRVDGGAYVITADRAIEDIARPNEVNLVEIRGDIGGRADAPGMKLSAARGMYDASKGVMDLAGEVRLSNADYNVKLKSAHVDFKTGVYESFEPVTVTTASGTTITADAASAAKNATLLTFQGRVKTQIPPQGDNGQIMSQMKGVQP